MYSAAASCDSRPWRRAAKFGYDGLGFFCNRRRLAAWSFYGVAAALELVLPMRATRAIAFGSLLAAAHGAGVTNVVGAALATPDECASLSCELRLGVVAHEIAELRASSRAATTAIPGPTLRASAGDTLAVTLVN